MSKTSLQLIAAFQKKGLLTKEAASDLLACRDIIIKEAMKKQAISLFKGLREAPAPTKKALSFIEKLKIGGRTPARMGKKGPEELPGWSDVAANLGKMMALAGLTAGASAGIGGLIRHGKDRKLRGEIDRSYNQMFNVHPGLQDLKSEGKGEEIRRNFGVLARYAPSLAADPTIAGSWVNSKLQLGGHIDPTDIKNLAETQRRIDETREDHGIMRSMPMQAHQLATKAMMV